MVGVRLGVGCPCQPVRNDIVTPRYLFFILESLTKEKKKRYDVINEETKMSKIYSEFRNE